jgi:hypothetical protein
MISTVTLKLINGTLELIQTVKYNDGTTVVRLLDRNHIPVEIIKPRG